MLNLLFILLLNKSQCEAGWERFTPYQSKNPSPTIPTYRKKEVKEKPVGDEKGTSSLYPESPHRQCVGLVFRRSHDLVWLSAASLVICSPACIAVCNTWSSGGTAPCRVGGATSQLDLPFLTPLSVAGCGWLQPGAPHWAASVNYRK